METRTGYAAVASHYRRLIAAGDLTPGDAMPTVNAVAEEHGVARNTAARAYDLLKREGLISTAAGAGTVVARRPKVVTTGSDRLARGEAGHSHYAKDETSTGHEAWRQPCPDLSICRALGIEPHGEVIVRRRVFRQDGRVTSIGLNHIHPRVAEDVPEVMNQGRLPTNWRTLYTERTGQEIHRSPELFGARHATRDEIEALEVSAPGGAAVPVLVSYSTHHDENGPVTVWEDIYAPDTFKEVRNNPQ